MNGYIVKEAEDVFCLQVRQQSQREEKRKWMAGAVGYPVARQNGQNGARNRERRDRQES